MLLKQNGILWTIYFMLATLYIAQIGSSRLYSSTRNIITSCCHHLIAAIFVIEKKVNLPFYLMFIFGKLLTGYCWLLLSSPLYSDSTKSSKSFMLSGIVKMLPKIGKFSLGYHKSKHEPCFLLYLIISWQWTKPRNTYWGGRFSTVDLLIKVACVVKNE